MIFIGLAGTVIDSWESFNPLEEQRALLQRYLSVKHPGKDIGIFSFHVQTGHDRRLVEATVIPSLEKDLGVRVVRTICMQEVVSVIESTLEVTLNPADLTKWGKTRLFTEWCHAHFQNGLLIDNAVPNRIIRDDGIEICFLNIESLNNEAGMS